MSDILNNKNKISATDCVCNYKAFIEYNKASHTTTLYIRNEIDDYGSYFITIKNTYEFITKYICNNIMFKDYSNNSCEYYYINRDIIKIIPMMMEDDSFVQII